MPISPRSAVGIRSGVQAVIAVASTPPGCDGTVDDESEQHVVELRPITTTDPDTTEPQNEVTAEQDRVC